MVVFDLDYTLWPFWVDTHVTPPLKAAQGNNTAAVDRLGEHYSFYGDIAHILHTLPQAGIKLAVASRTSTPELARDMLKILHVTPPVQPLEEGEKNNKRKDKVRRALDYFDGGLEVYPTSKTMHMEALQKKNGGLAFSDMLFFDDEARNRDVETLGVTMWLVRDGITWEEIDRGVKEWRRRRVYGGKR